MPMVNNDSRTPEQLWDDIRQAIRNDDQESFVTAHQQLMQSMREELRSEISDTAAANQLASDQAVLLARGQRALTSAEQSYYENLIQAMKASNPKQAISGMSSTMPETIIDSVFDELRTRHPLLSRIRFLPTGPITKIILNTNGRETAVWGDLFSTISKEINAGFKAVTTTLLKLSAWLAVPKDGFNFSVVYLDRFVRETLYEAYANGFEDAIVDGDGNGKPIGMTRQVGDGVTVTGGVYPRKAKIAVRSFDQETLGSLIGLLTTDENGKERDVRDLIIVCNVNDYYTKVSAATQIMAPDGSYRNALPFNIEVVPVAGGLKRGEAIIGLAYRYFGSVGSDLAGNIDYSDHFNFLDDVRTFIIKGYGNGFPMDNNAFQLLDISDLQPILLNVVTRSVPTASSDATLASLKLGKAVLSPAFAANTTSYTATTTDAKNVINAVQADAGASVAITYNSTTVVDNGTPITWAAGSSNVVVVTVTAEDGTTTKSYTVTVTKS